MKTLVLAAIRYSLMFLLPSVTYAISAQWDLDPSSGDWNTAANWTPNGVPNGPADVATFALSNTTNVSISADTTVDRITFVPGASAFTITVNPFISPTPNDNILTYSGAGITNNSGVTQNFVTAAGRNYNYANILFTNNASAGASTHFTNTGANAPFTAGGVSGSTSFYDMSTAANGTFTNSGATYLAGYGGFTNFFDNSTAANGFFVNDGGTFTGFGFGSLGGATRFLEASTAANGNFISNPATVSGSLGGSTQFYHTSTAGTATIVANGATISGAGGGITEFFDDSTAANATITNNGGTASAAVGGKTVFYGTSTADSATLIANGGTGGGEGGQILFNEASTGGTSRIELFGNGSLDISEHVAPGVTIGSIEGDGDAFLGRYKLTVGSNNLSTEFSGVIQDGGQNGGLGGSLTKIGSGTLILSGTNTYTGNTRVNHGVLQVDGSINSITSVRRRGTLGGTGMIHGNVTSRGEVSPGAQGTPGLLTVVGNYTQTQYATLMIQIAGANAGQFGVLNVFGTANLSGYLDPVLLNGFVPTVGQSFTFLNYGAVNGTLSMFNPNIDNEPAHWEVGYFPTYAILTVVPGNVFVPDQGSTLLLLTLGLLGLVTFRRRLLRNHQNRPMNPGIQLKNAIPFVVALACFGLSPTARAVVPPPDGGYPGQNTAEGDNALFSLTTGTDNTAIGFEALLSNTSGSFNTGTGSAALHANTTGSDNTATGFAALGSNTTGHENTAHGVRALNSNTTGNNNTATGQGALFINTTGSNNTATGQGALANNNASANTANGAQALSNSTNGIQNTATGFNALASNTIGSHNTADGVNALRNNPTGSRNTATGYNALRRSTGSNNATFGFNAGANLTTGNNNIDIGNPGVEGESGQIRIGTGGTHTAIFIAGIRRATVTGGIPVVVGLQGQLGTMTSSARFKHAVKPMDRASEAILALKPVIFHYKKEIDADSTPQFGLVAEDVEKVNPDLIIRDADGKPYTVRYDAVNAMLLNEFLKAHKKMQQQEAMITQLKNDLEATAARQREQIEALTAGLQKVSAQLDVNKPAPQTVLNNQ